MIKKLSALVLACSMLSAHGHDMSSWLEIKPGYFFFANHTLRKIYHGGFEIQGSVTTPLCGMIALYGSLGYIHVKGRSLGGHQKTINFQVPLDLGVRAIFELNDCVDSYLTVGPRYFYFHQHNDSTFVNRNIRRNGFGFFINGGCNFIQNDCFLVGIFGEYGFEQKSFRSRIPNVYGRRDLQIGGFTFGASVGFEF